MRRSELRGARRATAPAARGLHSAAAMTSLAPTNHLLAAELRRLVRGAVDASPAALAAASADFGGIVRRRPAVVVRPADVGDVAAVLGHARRRHVAVATRAASHSVSGQSLSEGGIVLAMRALDRVLAFGADAAGPWCDAQPGVVWRDLAAAALARGLVPPVMTDYLYTTVGGTHSVGGLGTASFRHGTQADNCLALEVVTPDGEVRWCSRAEHAELFEHVLCGFGQLGVITRVRLRLRRHGARVRTHLLAYARRDRLLAALRTLTGTEARHADYVAGRAVDAGGGRWMYVLTVTAEGDSRTAAAARADAAAALACADRVARTEDRAFADFILQDGAPDAHADTDACGHPWVDVVMPPAAADTYLAEMRRALPRALLAASTVLCWPLRRAALTRPLFALPGATADGDDDFLVLASIMPTVLRAELPRAAALMCRAGARAVELGGRRYLYGWAEPGLTQWRAHFGAGAWTALNRLKREHDPDGILNPGFIQYESNDEPHRRFGAERRSACSPDARAHDR